MRKLLLLFPLLAASLFVPASLFAQVSSNTAYRIRFGPTLPATCNPATGDVFFVYAGSVGTPYYCSTLNTWSSMAGSGGGGSVSSFSATATVGTLFTTIVTNPTTTPALAISLTSAAANLVFASPNGSSGVGSYRALVAADIPSLPYAPTANPTFTGTITGAAETLSGAVTLSGLSTGTQVSCLGLSSGNAVVLSSGACGTGTGGGTVTSFSSTATVGTLFTTSVATATTTPAQTITLASAAANLVFASPNGSSGVGSYRALVAADIPSLSYASLTGTNTYSGGGLQNFSSVQFQAPVNATDPASCAAGQFEFNSGGSFKGCTAANIWTTFAAGSTTAWGSITGGTNPNALLVSGTFGWTGSGIVSANNAGFGLMVSSGNLAVNTAVIPSHTQIHANDNFCSSTNGTGALTCTSPNAAITAYSTGQTYQFYTDTANPTTANIDNVGIKSIKLYDGSTSPPSGMIPATSYFTAVYDGTVFRLLDAPLPFTLTTTGSGAATYSGGVLNIPTPSSSGTVTSVGLAGTANQITVTGSSPITSSGSWTLSLPNSTTIGVQNSAVGGLTIAGGTVTGGIGLVLNGSGASPGYSVLSVNAAGTTLFLGSNNASVTTAGALTVTSCSGCGSASGTVTSVTFTGDGTVLSSTPSSAVTTSGTVTATLANAGAGTILGNNTGSAAAPSYLTGPLLGLPGTTAGTLGLANSAAAFSTTLASAATANNTVKFFAAAPANGDFVYCATSSTTCTLTDAGSNFTTSSIAYTGGATLTSSVIVAGQTTGTTKLGQNSGNAEITGTGPVIFQNFTNTVTQEYLGGQDASVSSGTTLGTGIFRGPDQSNTGTTPGNAGSAWLRGGNNAGALATAYAGSLQIVSGMGTNATTALPGMLAFETTAIKGTTVTQFNLAGPNGTANQTADAAATPNVVLGATELLATSGVSIFSEGQALVNASAAVTQDHFVCAASTASQVTDGGTTPCPLGMITFGIVRATSGTFASLGSGTAVTPSTTKPLVQILSKVASPMVVSDLTAQTAALTTQSLFTPTFTGMVRVSFWAAVTTPGTSSILGGTTGFVLNYTSPTGSVAQTQTLTGANQSGSLITIGTGNTGNTTTTLYVGSAMVYAKAGVAMTYNFGYSSTGTTMQYEIHVRVEPSI